MVVTFNRHGQIIIALRHIARQQAKIIALLEADAATATTKTTGQLNAFRSKMWSAFCEHLASNIGRWMAGMPLWLLAFQGIGLRHWLEKLLGFFM